MQIAYSALGAGHAPLWTTAEAGLFAEEGLDAQVVFIKGSRGVADAVLAGQVEFGHIAAPAAVESNLHGADLVVITGALNTLIQRLITRSEIRAVGQLRGKTLGVGQDIDNRILRHLLPQHGLELEKDVAVRHIESQPDAIERLEAGEIDGSLFSFPYAFEATKRGYTFLVDCGHLKLDYQLDGLVARRPLLEGQPDTTRRLVRAYVRGMHHYKTQPDFVVASVLRKYSLIEDETIARQCYAALDRHFPRAPYPTLPGIQTILEHLAERDPVARTAEPKTMIDERWVGELDESGFIRELYAS